MAIDVGDTYRCNFTLKSPSGGNVNADLMMVTIGLPDGTSEAPVTVASTSTGVYQYDYVTTQAGRHLAHWVGTGTNFGAYLDAFDVRPADAPYIVSLADVKAQTNIENTADDEELRGWIEAATGVIERHLGKAVVRRQRVEDVQASGYVSLTWAPVLTLVSVASVDGTATWEISDLHVSADTGGVVAKTGKALSGFLTVTYVSGTQVIPAEYAKAACVIVQHLWTTQRGPKGASVGGGMDSTLGFHQAGYAIPNAALELLGAGLPGIA